MHNYNASLQDHDTQEMSKLMQWLGSSQQQGVELHKLLQMIFPWALEIMFFSPLNLVVMVRISDNPII